MRNHRHRFVPLSLFVLFLLAAIFRVHGLFTSAFHPQEALYATWGREIAAGNAPFLRGAPLQEPPGLPYLLALFYTLPGLTAAWVARLPAFIGSLLLVPLTARLVWSVYHDRLAMVIATVFIALSPFAIQFSATAFAAPLATVLLVAALATAAGAAGDKDRSSPLAGIFFALAVATQEEAWLFLPLLVGLLIFTALRGAARRQSNALGRRIRRTLTSFMFGALPLLLVLLLWQLVRSDDLVLPGGQMENLLHSRLVWSWELWPRLEAWGELVGIMIGSPIVTFLLVLALPIFLALLIYEQDWPTAFDQLFLLFLLAYLVLHWFIALPVQDRSLLSLLPLLALLLGRFLSRVVAFTAHELPAPARAPVQGALVVALVLLMLPSAWAGREGAFPVGGRQGAQELAHPTALAAEGVHSSGADGACLALPLRGERAPLIQTLPGAALIAEPVCGTATFVRYATVP
ncbi:MAG: glycosyltransferase family 39 protein [Candidatus Promineifilaceae bacterium]|nr:glycosyltransferase family 39 protein [Candidatus Promineifilaceae bacterium]